MGATHPIAWYQSVGAGRSWYTGLGHTVATYSAPFFQQHLLGGILFASSAVRQVTVTSTQPYGLASGTPTLALTGRLATNQVDFVVAGGTSGEAGLLLLSTCSDSFRFGPYTLLADAGPAHFIALLARKFDARGQAIYPLPGRFALPAFAGTTLFLQGAQATPALGLSNGLRVSLTPR